MKDELIKWRVITDGVKRGLFETKANALAKARWYRAQGIKNVKVARHVVKPGKCKPAAITGGV